LRILLYDHDGTGHHLEYAGHLAAFLRDQGDEVSFASWDRPSRPGDPIIDQPLGDVTHLAHEGSGDRLARVGAWPLARAQGVHRCLRLGSRGEADVIHFLFLDRSGLGLLASLSLRSTKAAVFGTLFHP